MSLLLSGLKRAKNTAGFCNGKGTGRPWQASHYKFPHLRPRVYWGRIHPYFTSFTSGTLADLHQRETSFLLIQVNRSASSTVIVAESVTIIFPSSSCSPHLAAPLPHKLLLLIDLGVHPGVSYPSCGRLIVNQMFHSKALIQWGNFSPVRQLSENILVFTSG